MTEEPTLTCPMCGSPVVLVSSDEGTSYYRPARADYHEVGFPFEQQGRWHVVCACGWEAEEKSDGAAKHAGNEHLNAVEAGEG